jgi:tRNA U34 5-carboxymethylaminomethyl modifying GTPase MnmE/TrmE
MSQPEIASDPVLPTRKLLLVGQPNVGKSLLFTRLTQRYATVSNYPGTTVELTRSLAEIDGELREVIDTPGTKALTPQSGEERVTRDLIIASGGNLLVGQAILERHHRRRQQHPHDRCAVDARACPARIRVWARRLDQVTRHKSQGSSHNANVTRSHFVVTCDVCLVRCALYNVLSCVSPSPSAYASC